MAEKEHEPSRTLTSPTPPHARPGEGRKPGEAGEARKARTESERGDELEIPPLSELEEELGDQPGSIRLDFDLETGKARKVKVDEKGKESGK